MPAGSCLSPGFGDFSTSPFPHIAFSPASAAFTKGEHSTCLALHSRAISQCRVGTPWVYTHKHQLFKEKPFTPHHAVAPSLQSLDKGLPEAQW